MSISLNLIPPATLRKHALRRVTRIGVAAVVVSGVWTAAYLGVEWLRGVSALRELTELDARYAPFMQIVDDRSNLASQIANLRSREEIALRLSRDQHGVVLLGVLSKSAADSDGRVYFDSLLYQGPPPDAPSNASRTMQLSGVGVDGMAVAGFASRLRESGVFEDVMIENTQPLSQGAAGLRQFSLAGSL